MARSMTALLPIFLLAATMAHADDEAAPAKRDAARSDAPDRVEIGDRIERLEFKDIRYLPRSLGELSDARAVVLVFTNTTCPLVQRYLPRLTRMHEKFSKEGVTFLSVNVGPEDTIRDMAGHALEYEVPFAVVKDTDGSVVTALGVDRTPEVVVLDEKRHLVYRGRIDDQYRIGGVRPKASRNDLEEAITQLLAGDPIAVPETPVDGCKITAVRPEIATDADWTYHADIAPIVDANCAPCHQRGGGAPFSLTTFDKVRANGEMIAEVVHERRMPPWYASPHYGTFQNDRSLGADERTRILEWIASGMREGAPPTDTANPTPDRSSVPTANSAEKTSRWRIPEPDLVLKHFFPHKIPADGYIPYRYVVLPHVFTRETWIEAFEILPDNKTVVHHANLAYGAPGEEPGYGTFITGYVPGGQPMDLTRFEGDVAFKLPAYSVLGLQIHYVTTGRPEKSTLSVGIRFKRDRVKKQLHYNLADPHRFRIPPGHPAYPIRDAFKLKEDATILGLFSHMHLRGKDMTFYAHRPDGTTETLLQIPNYSFDWQLGYEIAPGTARFPKGTKIEAVAHFDNSPFNPYNPDPTKTVRYGPQTFHEMMNGYVFYTHDDEKLDIALDASGHVREKRED